MNSRKKNAALVLTGVLVGTILTGPAVHAAEEYLKAYRSSQAIYLNEQQIHLEAYTIDGSNYVKLRDVGAALDFNVYWDGAVQIDSDAPYTGSMKKAEYNFKCYTYGKRGKAECSPHHIREFELTQIVLDDLRRVTHFARMKERQFAAYINRKNCAELRREMNTLQKELDAMRKRSGELSVLFKRLYEDHVLGRVTNEQFRMLSSDYNAEQKALEEAIPEKEARLEKLKASAANVDAFIEKAKRYTAIDELTPELLRLFIQRIEVGERSQKYSRNAAQSIRIVYRDIGSMDSAMLPGEAEPNIIPPLTVAEVQKLLA